MDFITTIWGKLNKPIHFLLVGAAILLFSPAEYNWLGYPFVAFGLAGTVEWLWKHAINFRAELQRRHAMSRIVSHLNADERKILQTQLQKN